MSWAIRQPEEDSFPGAIHPLVANSPAWCLSRNDEDKKQEDKKKREAPLYDVESPTAEKRPLSVVVVMVASL